MRAGSREPASVLMRAAMADPGWRLEFLDLCARWSMTSLTPFPAPNLACENYWLEPCLRTEQGKNFYESRSTGRSNEADHQNTKPGVCLPSPCSTLLIDRGTLCWPFCSITAGCRTKLPLKVRRRDTRRAHRTGTWQVAREALGWGESIDINRSNAKVLDRGRPLSRQWQNVHCYLISACE